MSTAHASFVWDAEDLKARGGKLDLHADVRPRNYAIDLLVRTHGNPTRVERVPYGKRGDRVLFRLDWDVPSATIDGSAPREAGRTPERGGQDG